MSTLPPPANMDTYIHNKLSHLSVAERKRVFTMLCIVGLEYIEMMGEVGRNEELSALVLNGICGMICCEIC